MPKTTADLQQNTDSIETRNDLGAGAGSGPVGSSTTLDGKFYRIDQFISVMGQTIFTSSEDPAPEARAEILYNGVVYRENAGCVTRAARVINWIGPFSFDNGEMVEVKYLVEE